MAFQLSPGVNVSEIDLTTVVPAVATTEGAIAGVFRWGPTNERVLINSEVDLVRRFGTPFQGVTSSPVREKVIFDSFVLHTDNTTGVDQDDPTDGVQADEYTESYRLTVGAKTYTAAKTNGNFSSITELASLLQAQIAASAESTLYSVAVEDVSGTDRIVLTWTVYADQFDITYALEYTVGGGTDGADDTAPTIVQGGAGVETTSWSNVQTFFTAANFLAYSDALYVTRVASATTLTATAQSFDAAYPGAIGNSLKVAWANATSYAAEDSVSETLDIAASSTEGTLKGSSNVLSVEEGDIIVIGNQELRITGLGTPTDNSGTWETTVTFGNKYIGVADQTGATVTKKWGYYAQFDAAPSSDSHYHIVVIDEFGEFVGKDNAGGILEAFTDVSMTAGDKKYDGSTNYLPEVLENFSSYIRLKSAAAPIGSAYQSLDNGTDGDGEDDVSNGTIAMGYDLYKNAEEIDVSLILTGRPNTVIANYVIDNICETRKDCIAFVSPQVTVGTYTAQDAVAAVATLSSSSYAVVDSGYKYQYDKYADKYRWIAMNGDVAGTCARTDDTRDPWFSPAGYARGAIKNVVKLGLNPSKADRDLLYKNGINPIITQPGQGTLLFGDKTFLNQPSAFDRINVRRLFIVLEKAIAVAAKSTLFEFNDEFTRAQFRNLIEPYLRDVQGRRGIYDFRVVADDTNNTAEVIDRNEFVGDIYIKPARAINFIQLNFVAVRTGVEFSEIVGQ
jgi:hypothetical protein